MKRHLSKKFKTAVFMSLSVMIGGIFCITLVSHNKINIEIAKTSAFEDSLNSPGYALRDEEVVYLNSGENNIMFLYSDTEKFSKNSIIAKVYKSSEDLKKAYTLNFIENQLKLIENNTSMNSIGINVINKNIINNIRKYCVSHSDYYKNSKLCSKLWHLMNKKEVEFGKKNSLSEKINDLKEKKNQIEVPQEVGCILAPSYGEFLKYTDGFENSLEFKKDLETFDIEKLKAEIYPKKPLGKIIKSETWYAIFKVPYEEAKKVKDTADISLSVVDKDYIQNIPVSLEHISGKDDSNNCVIVLSCDVMNEEIAYLRKENFKLTLGNYWGIKVNKQALYKQKDSSNQFGVFVKQNNYLKFKEINIIFAGLDFVICEYGPDFYENEKYIQPGDKIVSSGAYLYDGKRVR